MKKSEHQGAPVRRWHYHKATQAISAGNIIAYPTEAVYGLGCDPLNTKAIQRLIKIKKRPNHKGLIVLADSISRIVPFIEPEFFQQHEARLMSAWPGPITLICTASNHLPKLLTGYRRRIALRVTSHPTAAALIAACRHPIVSTSANITHKPAATSAWEVRKQFKNQLGYIVPGSVGELGNPTPILDLATEQWIRR